MRLILSLGSGKQDIVTDQFVCVKYGRFLPSIFFFKSTLLKRLLVVSDSNCNNNSCGLLGYTISRFAEDTPCTYSLSS